MAGFPSTAELAGGEGADTSDGPATKRSKHAEEKACWIYLGFDRGADPAKLMALRGWKRFHLVPDPGHTLFAFVRLILELLWALGASELAECFGFTVPGSQSYLESGANQKKTMQFIEVLEIVLFLCAVRQYRQEQADNMTTAATFDEWLEDDQGDVTFRSNAFLLRVVFPAYRLLVASHRLNKMVMFMTACKILIRFSFMLGKYSPCT